jgi:hypothetical protein
MRNLLDMGFLPPKVLCGFGRIHCDGTLASEGRRRKRVAARIAARIVARLSLGLCMIPPTLWLADMRNVVQGEPDIAC